MTVSTLRDLQTKLDANVRELESDRADERLDLARRSLGRARASIQSSRRVQHARRRAAVVV